MKQNSYNSDEETNPVPPNELSPEIDPPKDREKLKPETTSLDMPDAREIPGQEHITPPPAGELAGRTASSADEEGEGVLDDNSIVDEDAGSNVSPMEKKDLFISANDMPGDDENLRHAALDSVDEDGTPLNEDSFNANISPSDLDVPGAALDDESEDIGAEDEENNPYSLGGEKDESSEPRDQY